MTFRHNKSRQFEVGLPDASMSEWNSPSPYFEAGIAVSNFGRPK